MSYQILWPISPRKAKLWFFTELKHLSFWIFKPNSPGKSCRICKYSLKNFYWYRLNYDWLMPLTLPEVCDETNRPDVEKPLLFAPVLRLCASMFVVIGNRLTFSCNWGKYSIKQLIRSDYQLGTYPADSTAEDQLRWLDTCQADSCYECRASSNGRPSRCRNFIHLKAFFFCCCFWLR